MVFVHGSVGLTFEKFEGLVDFKEHFLSRLLFVFIGVIFKGEGSVVFSELREFGFRGGLENVIGVPSEIGHEFLECFHL